MSDYKKKLLKLRNQDPENDPEQVNDGSIRRGSFGEGTDVSLKKASFDQPSSSAIEGQSYMSKTGMELGEDEGSKKRKLMLYRLQKKFGAN